MLNIRRAEIKDIPTIMQFLEDHWLHGFALAHDRGYFEWQFVHDEKINIWIGIDDETGKLYAIQSMIIYTYDENPDVSGSVWLAVKSPNPMLAFDIQEKMCADLNPRASFSPGLRPDAVKAYSLMGYPIVSMDHFYRLADRSDYSIAIINNKMIPDVPDSGYRLSKIDSIEAMRAVIPEDILLNSAPRKDYRYIKWRYFDHPIFHYDIRSITDENGIPCAILITREEHANDSVSCKIVDFYGDSIILGRITTALDKLIKEREYEYIDIYSYGVPVEIYEAGGLVRCNTDSENIITNFFQPYIPINSDIYMVPVDIPGTRLFRGDSDQDKPRLME